MPLLTVNELAKKTGADREAVSRWLSAALEPKQVKQFKDRQSKLYDEKEATKIINANKRGPRAKVDDGDEIDPITGLTWFKANLREDVLRKRAEREEAEATQKKTWILISEHHEILTAVVNRLEVMPGKARSELGLSESQAEGLRRMIDEIRKEASTEVLKPK